MITYFEEEHTVNGVLHWIDISSVYIDGIVFHLGYGEPVDLNNPENHKRHNFYSLTREMYAEINEYFVTHEKPDWMGSKSLVKPFSILSNDKKEYAWIDFKKIRSGVTVLTGHYPIDGVPSDGNLLSYTVPAEIFIGM